MKKFYVFATTLLLAGSVSAQQSLIDFEELVFPTDEKIWNGSNGEGFFSSKNGRFNNVFDQEWESWSGFAYSKMTDASTPGFGNQFSVFAPQPFWNGSDETGGFDVNSVSFNNIYNPDWSSWSGFSYSNSNDNETEGFENQYSSISGGGYDGQENYLIYTEGGEVSFETPVQVNQLVVTNTTYAYYSMLNGDDFAAQFEQDDWFILTVYGWDENDNLLEDSVNFYLADFRDDDSDNHYILNSWENINLTELGEVSKLSFKLSSSDVGEWGMNTPNYFALGGLTFQSDEEISLDFDVLNFPSTGNNGSQNYAVWYSDGVITFDSLVEMESLSVANTTYAALAMKEGDDFATQFGQDDWFRLTVFGWNENDEKLEDSVVVYLADFRDSDPTQHYVLEHWEQIDLTVFDEVKSLSFVLASSDVGEWGMNTPNYFALDDILYSVLEVEEDDLSVKQIVGENIHVYPNPCADRLFINAPAGDVKLTNLNGQVVFETSHATKTEIDVAHYPKGMYVLYWNNQEKQLTQKIIIQ